MESIPNQLQQPQSLQLLLHKKAWMIAGTAPHCFLEMHELPNMLGSTLNIHMGPYQIIKTLQSLVTLKKLQSTTMNPSLRQLPCHPVLMLLRLQPEAWKLPRSSSADPIPQWHAATGRYYCLPGTLWITTMISPWRWWSDPPLGHPVCHLPPSNKPLALVVPSSHHKSQTLMFLS